MVYQQLWPNQWLVRDDRHDVFRYRTVSDANLYAQPHVFTNAVSNAVSNSTSDARAVSSAIPVSHPSANS